MDIVLSPSSRETLQRAQATSILFNKKELDCESIFYAICLDKNSLASNIISQFANTDDILNQYKDKFAELLSNWPKNKNSNLLISTEVQESQFLAKEFCQNIRSEYICDEHLLYGIVCIKSFTRILAKKFKIDSIKLKDALVLQCKEYNHNKISVSSINQDILTDSENKSGAIYYFASDMNELALNGNYDPLIGRDKEMDLLIKTLCRKNKNNVIVLGEAGVGKTHLIEGLVQKINNGTVPEFLLNSRIFNLNLGSMIAGSKLRGQFEERLYAVLDDIKRQQDFKSILFIDEIHMLMGAGDPNGSLDAANILKPALSRGDVQVIGATTYAEYKNSIEKDKAMARRFQTIKYDEPSKEETVAILKGLKSSYELFHCVNVDDDVINYIVDSSIKYIPDRYLPDKAIDLLDQSSTSVKINNYIFSEEVVNIKNKLQDSIFYDLNKRKIKVLSKKSYAMIDNLNKTQQKWIEEYKKNPPKVTQKDVESIILNLTGLSVIDNKKERLTKLSSDLKNDLINQDAAIDPIVNSLFKSQAQLGDNNRPIGSFLFIGKSGVGKTYLGKLLAKYWFGSENNLIQFDMSEFSEKEKASRLIGTTPGYIGYEEGGQLIEAIKKKPGSVLLFDEIEKAHPDVLNLFLQILDEGRVTDGAGRIGDFKNSIIIFTSNIGTNTKKTNLGFGETDNNEKINDSVKNYFKTEFLNRLNKVVIFNDLNKNDIKFILEKEIKKINEKLSKNKICFTLSSELENFLLNKIDISNGAREIKKVVEENVVDFLSKEIIFENIKDGESVILDLADGKIQKI